MDKRYQVFVSSTYSDLHEERQEVMQALLELDCIPSGMELFPAANEDQWTLIKRVIDDCDYYIVIIAGRYGSVGPAGLSFTEMEYEYALAKSKPVMAFLHKDPGKLIAERTEKTEKGREQLAAFREFVQKKLVKFWDSPADLGSKVSRGLVHLIKTNPAIGWVRSDQALDETSAKEILNLKTRIEQLQAQLNQVSTEPPPGTETLARDKDLFTAAIEISAVPPGEHSATRFWGNFETTWTEIFSFVSPMMIDELSEEKFENAIDSLAQSRSIKQIRESSKFDGFSVRNIVVSGDDFQTIKVQLRALGLIAKSVKPRSVKDTDTYWTLTPYGDTVMTRLRAIQRE